MAYSPAGLPPGPLKAMLPLSLPSRSVPEKMLCARGLVAEPKVVPSKLITRLRAAPWNKGDSEDMAAANAAAPPRPCTKRSRPIKGTDEAQAMASVARQNTPRPDSHTRRLPSTSVRLPATIMALP